MSEQNKLELSLNDRFEQERYGRLIDSLSSPADLKRVAKDLLSLYIGQKSAARWAMGQSLSAPPRHSNLIPSQEYLDGLYEEVSQRQHDPDQSSWEEDLTG